MSRLSSNKNLIRRESLFILCLLGLIGIIYIMKKRIEPFETLALDDSKKKITKVIFQTSRERPSETVIDNFKKVMPSDWRYEHYNDDDIRQFFIENPLEEFRHIQNVFDSFKTGAHKADLFRYYYIYVKGGVFVDSDARLEIPIDLICKDYSFISVESMVTPNTIFQGLIGASPRHPIVYDALKDAYYTEPERLQQNYFLFVANLFTIFNNHPTDSSHKLYREVDVPLQNYGKLATTYDPDNEIIILKHFHNKKIVPALGTDII